MNYQKQLEKPNRHFDFRLRIRALAFLFLVSFFILFLKLFYLQILQHKLYYNYAEGQFEKKLVLNANRGIIYDRNENILVKNILGYSLFLSPSFFNESKSYKKRLLQFLSHFLKMDIKDLNRIIKKRQGKNPFMPLLIKKNLSKQEYVYLMTHQSYIKGILVKAFSKRFYPLNENLAHLLGYIGTINSKDWEEKQSLYSDLSKKNPYRLKNTILGQDGIEKVYDLKLRGEDGLAQSLVTAEGRFIEGSLKIIKKSNPGKNLVLTIDIDLQEFIAELMKGKRGVVIVSLASTGELLAFFTNPSFNPNLIWKDSELSEIQKDPKKSFYHRALYGRYSPGSIFKIIAAIAAIEEAGLDPRRKKFFCKGSVLLGNRYFKCYNSKRHGLLNMYEALEKSCNVYFYKLAGEIGWNPIYKWARKFGLGDGHTLKELDFKSEGLMPDENWKKQNTKVKTWLPGDTYNHVIGQGYTLLYPLEIHNIMSIIVNKGILYQPFLLKKLYIDNDIFESRDKEILKRIYFKRKTMDFLKEALQSVITDGTAYWGTRFIKVPIMGKTGTSQAVLNNEEISNAMFTAYGPVDGFKKPNSTKLLKDEKIIVTVIVEKTEESSSTVAVPITSAIFKWYFEKKDRKSIKNSLSYFKSFSNSNFLEENILDNNLKNKKYQKLLDSNVKSLEEDILLFQSNLNNSLKDFYMPSTFKAKVDKKESLKKEAVEAKIEKQESLKKEAIKAKVEKQESLKKEAIKAKIEKKESLKKEAIKAKIEKKESLKKEAIKAKIEKKESLKKEAIEAKVEKQESLKKEAIEAKIEKKESLKKEAIEAKIEKKESLKKEAIEAKVEQKESLKKEAIEAKAEKQESLKKEAIEAKVEKQESLKKEAIKAKVEQKESLKKEAIEAKVEQKESLKKEAVEPKIENKESPKKESLKKEEPNTKKELEKQEKALNQENKIKVLEQE